MKKVQYGYIDPTILYPRVKIADYVDGMFEVLFEEHCLLDEPGKRRERVKVTIEITRTGKPLRSDRKVAQ